MFLLVPISSAIWIMFVREEWFCIEIFLHSIDFITMLNLILLEIWQILVLCNTIYPVRFFVYLSFIIHCYILSFFQSCISSNKICKIYIYYICYVGLCHVWPPVYYGVYFLKSMFNHSSFWNIENNISTTFMFLLNSSFTLLFLLMWQAGRIVSSSG